MKEHIPTLIIIHVLAGGLSLVSGLAAMILKKGKEPHRFAGRVFFYCMTVIFISTLTISLIKQLHFLLMIGLFSYYLVVSGYRSLYHKQLHWSQKPNWIDWLINGTAVIAMLFLFAFGVIKLVGGNLFGIVSIVFGFIGLNMVYGTIKNFVHTPGSKTIWIEGHITGMIGGYIAAFTAFFVVNNDELIGLPGVVAWLLPTAIGVPFMMYWIKKYKKPVKTSKYVQRSNDRLK